MQHFSDIPVLHTNSHTSFLNQWVYDSIFSSIQFSEGLSHRTTPSNGGQLNEKNAAKMNAISLETIA